MKDKIIKFLKHIGYDYSPDKTVEIWAECKGQGEDDETCPNHRDCGICRYKYMKKKGWLREEASK